MAADWLSKVGRGITAALDDALSPEKGKGASKKAKGEKGGVIDLAESSGLSSEASAWVAKTVKKSIAASQTSFANDVHERFISVEQSVGRTDIEVAQHRVEVDDLKIKMNEVATQVEKLVEENARLSIAASQASTICADLSQRMPESVDTQLLEDGLRQMEEKINKKIAEQTTASSSTPSVPYEARTSVRIGSLGWDTPKDELEARAKQLLAQLQIVVGTDISEPVAPSRGGSHCDAVFTDARKVQVAKLACQSKAISFHKNGEKTIFAWIDAKKTREELRPARLTHRALEWCVAAINGRENPPVLAKDLIGKRVTADGKVICFSLHGSLNCTPLAATLFPGDVDQLIGYAEAN